jgi:hypothetical protein
LPRSISALETLMGNETIDSTIISQAQEAMDFMANVLEASTEYSIIGKDLEGKILLWDEGAPGGCTTTHQQRWQAR